MANTIANLLGKVNASNALVVTLDGGSASATTFVGPAADNTAAPPFTFSGDLNTGLASAAADTLALVAGGTTAATFANPTGASQTSNFFSIVATIPPTSAQFNAVRWLFTEPENETETIRLLSISNTPATAGGSHPFVGVSSSVQSATSGRLVGGSFSATNFNGSTGGTHLGIGVSADDGDWNIGVSSDAFDAGTYNVAVWGNAEPTATNTIGGLFQLQDAHGLDKTPPAVSAALVADNVASGLPMFLGLANGVEKFRIGPTAVTSGVPITAADGVVGGPGFNFLGEVTTGIYRSGTGTISFAGTGTRTAFLSGATFATNSLTLDLANQDVVLSRGAAGRVDTTKAFRMTPVAFASLPTAAEGAIASVSDSNTATWGATIAGGGANKVLAYYNGTNWTVAGK